MANDGGAVGGPPPDEPGVFLRPPIQMVESTSVVPDANLIRPPPNRFTHELARDAPYWYDAAAAREPDGVLVAGTAVMLLVAGEVCWVVDASGLYVAVSCDAVQPLANG